MQEDLFISYFENFHLQQSWKLNLNFHSAIIISCNYCKTTKNCRCFLIDSKILFALFSLSYSDLKFSTSSFYNNVWTKNSNVWISPDHCDCLFKSDGIFCLQLAGSNTEEYFSLFWRLWGDDNLVDGEKSQKFASKKLKILRAF